LIDYLKNGTDVPGAVLDILFTDGIVLAEDLTDEVCKHPKRLRDWLTHLELLKAIQVDLPGAETLLEALVQRRDLRIADVVARAVSCEPTELDPFSADNYLALFHAIVNAQLFSDELIITHPRTLAGLVMDARAAAEQQHRTHQTAA
jgi:hypothetical protein